MSTAVADVIDHLVGITAGSRLDAIRAQRRQARDNAQASFEALFQPDNEADMPLPERFTVAVFVAGLHGQDDIAAFYAAGLSEKLALDDEIARGRVAGPYGHYPAGKLSVEDVEGPSFAVSDATRAALGPRLAAALAHAHLLVFHPRDASPAALQALLDAGWSTTGIVTLSQLVAFLSFQIRVIVGLRALAGNLAA
jgi:CMD domain protein